MAPAWHSHGTSGGTNHANALHLRGLNNARRCYSHGTAGQTMALSCYCQWSCLDRSIPWVYAVRLPRIPIASSQATTQHRRAMRMALVCYGQAKGFSQGTRPGGDPFFSGPPRRAGKAVLIFAPNSAANARVRPIAGSAAHGLAIPWRGARRARRGTGVETKDLAQHNTLADAQQDTLNRAQTP